MTQNDPTDHALAAIAKILDKPDTPPDAPDTISAESPAEKPEVQLAEEILTAPPSASQPPPPTVAAVVEAKPAHDDADDNETADNEDTGREEIEPTHTGIELAESDTYSKLGPGPLAAIRFKWTARRDGHGDYFVDETIGENSHPIVNGPMTKEAAIKLVDLRERQARQRFDALRSEMSGGEIGRSADE